LARTQVVPPILNFGKVEKMGSFRVIAALATTLATVCGAGAEDITWVAAGDGVTFGDPANWEPAVVPGADDVAHFDEVGGMIVVEDGVINLAFAARDVALMLDLAGGTYMVGGGGLLAPGSDYNTADLTLANGIFQSAGPIVIGEDGVGILRVLEGGAAVLDSVWLGNNIAAQGTLVVEGLVQPQLTVVGSPEGHATGRLEMRPGGKLAGTELIMRSGGTLEITLDTSSGGPATVPIELDGPALLGGELRVVIDKGAAIEPGTTFTLLQAATIVGNFASVDVPPSIALSHDGTSYIAIAIDETVIPGDINNDGATNQLDLVEVLASWGPCADPPSLCPADVDGNGAVGATDLVIVICNWQN
jgi:hypothetical protein